MAPPRDSYVIQLEKTIAEQRKRLDKFEKLFKKAKPSQAQIKAIQEQRRNKREQPPINIKSLFKSQAHIKAIQEQRRNRKEQPPINIKSLFKEYSSNFINKTTFHNIPGVDLTYTYNNENNFEQKVKQSVYNEIQQQVNTHRHVKVMISVTAVFMDLDGNIKEISQRLKTFEVTYMKSLNLDDKFEYIKQMLLEVEQGDSDLRFQYVKEYKVNIVKNSKIRGSKYIPTPTSIKGKQSILNIQNNDNYCFLYCIAAADNPINGKDHPYRPCKYNINQYNIQNITFPMELDQIEIFEQQNNKSINVFAIEDDDDDNIISFEPLYISKFDYDQKIDLLLLQEENNIKIHEHELLINVKLTKKDVVRENFHYTLIKNFNALAHGVLHNTLTIPKKKDDPDYFYHICRKCLTSFTCKTTYDKHNEFCKTGLCGVKMPPQGSTLRYKDYMQRKYMTKHPIVGYLDFEAILEPINEQAGDSTLKTQLHTSSSYSLYFVTDLDITNKYTLYRGEDVMENLMNTIKDVAKEYLELSVKFPICPVLTQEEESKFKNAKYCVICNKTLNEATYITKEGRCIKDYRVRHHCHFTNKFIGAAHTYM